MSNFYDFDDYVSDNRLVLAAVDDLFPSAQRIANRHNETIYIVLDWENVVGIAFREELSILDVILERVYPQGA